MVTILCKNCGKAFGLNRPDARIKYCAKCAKHREPKKAPHPIITCPVCGKRFSKQNTLHKYCSTKCKDKFHTTRYQEKVNTHLLKCKHCGRAFSTYKSNKDYCSPRCYSDAKAKRERLRRLRNATDPNRISNISLS